MEWPYGMSLRMTPLNAWQPKPDKAWQVPQLHLSNIT